MAPELPRPRAVTPLQLVLVQMLPAWPRWPSAGTPVSTATTTEADLLLSVSTTRSWRGGRRDSEQYLCAGRHQHRYQCERRLRTRQQGERKWGRPRDLRARQRRNGAYER